MFSSSSNGYLFIFIAFAVTKILLITIASAAQMGFIKPVISPTPKKSNRLKPILTAR